MDIRNVGNTLLRYTPKPVKYLLVVLGCIVKMIVDFFSGTEKDDLEESVFYVECQILGILKIASSGTDNREGWLTTDEITERLQLKTGSTYPEHYFSYAIKRLVHMKAIEHTAIPVTMEESDFEFKIFMFRFLDDSQHKTGTPKKHRHSIEIVIPVTT